MIGGLIVVVVTVAGSFVQHASVVYWMMLLTGVCVALVMVGPMWCWVQRSDIGYRGVVTPMAGLLFAILSLLLTRQGYQHLDAEIVQLRQQASSTTTFWLALSEAQRDVVMSCMLGVGANMIALLSMLLVGVRAWCGYFVADWDGARRAVRWLRLFTLPRFGILAFLLLGAGWAIQSGVAFDLMTSPAREMLRT